jgi:hypothetical protein
MRLRYLAAEEKEVGWKWNHKKNILIWAEKNKASGNMETMFINYH